jgi:hypothetical protein
VGCLPIIRLPRFGRGRYPLPLSATVSARPATGVDAAGRWRAASGNDGVIVGGTVRGAGARWSSRNRRYDRTPVEIEIAIGIEIDTPIAISISIWSKSRAFC